MNGEFVTTNPNIPVTILTGFLGSGKTTLINYLLNHHNDEKILIIENEFGQVNIDSGIIKNDANIQIVEMTNGCICCSVQGELIQALYKLNQQRSEGLINFDRLIIETTGLADPAPIIQTFFIDEVIRSSFQLDAIITLVDCKHILKHLDEHRVASSQIGFADRIILTKIDQINDIERSAVLARITRINNKAIIFEAFKGQIAKSEWLDIHAFDLNDSLEINHGVFVIDASKPLTHNFKPFKTNTLNKNSWEDNIFSYVFEAGELDLTKIGQFTEQLIEQYGNDMLRYKGVLAIKDQPLKLIVQGVHKVVGFDYGSEWENSQDKISRLIIISRKLPFEELKQAFLTTVAD